MRIVKCFPVLLLSFVLGCRTHHYESTDYQTIKIYHTNDVHSHLSPDGRGRGGLAYLASVLKVVKEQDHDNSSLILDAGDFYKKGSLPAQRSDDQVTADLMKNLAYYDARAVGNNEFKVGVTKLLEWAKSKEPAPLLSANFVDKDRKPAFTPSMVVKKGGLKIGIIGITAPVSVESDVQADPKADPRAPYQVLKPDEVLPDILKSLRPQVDVLILLSHQPYVENVKLAQQHPEIDLIVSGHSHILTKDQKRSDGNMVVEAGQFGQQMGVVTLQFNRQEHKVANLESTFWPIGVDYQVPEKKIEEEIKKAYEKWSPESFTNLGRADGNMDVIWWDNTFEGALDNWVADLMYRDCHCDVALINRELVREAIYKGRINKEDLFLAVPYNNKVAVVQLPKIKLQHILEGNILRNVPKYVLFPFAFSHFRAELQFQQKQISSVSFHDLPEKDNIEVGLPDYVAQHCLEFFKAEECPLKIKRVGREVRTLMEEEIRRIQTLKPLAKDRVRVTGL